MRQRIVPQWKSGIDIISLIEHFPVPASFKEADTGKYIVNNAINSRQFGIDNPQDLVGLTIHDVRFGQPKWGAQYAHSIAKLDLYVREKKTVAIGKHQFLDDSGEVQLEEMTKMPILGTRRNILGIVTYRYDITSTLSSRELYELYRSFYDASNAVKRVLTCLDIDQYFTALPTQAQFRVFLSKSERFTNREIAKLLGISDRTVECHIDDLRSKVVDNNLQQALAAIKRDALCAGN